MEYERIPGPGGQNELWAYEWDLNARPPTKINRLRLGVEPPPPLAVQGSHLGAAVTWSYGRTLGNIATTNPDALRAFPALSGQNAILDCEIVDAGLYQNGRPRSWCRTHQKHWGIAADVADAALNGALRCAQQTQPMWYVVNPQAISLDDYAEVGIWCSMPAALTSRGVPHKRYPRLHVHLRNEIDGPKILDHDFDALTLTFDPAKGLFGATPIDRVHVTPPVAEEFVLVLERGDALTCFNCVSCGSPHLDLGEFVRRPHVKHLCGNCGRDSTWTRSHPSVSNPLKPLHDSYSAGWQYVDVNRTLNIDDYPEAEFALWASTPAVVWTADRPQERGIHVHLTHNGGRIDDTFGEVIYRGRRLDRTVLLSTMIQNTRDD
jgi:hypothetical protein